MAGRRRFFKTAGVGEAGQGFAVTLDEQLLRTPADAPLLLPGRALAEAIAREWAEQETVIRPHAMPLTQLACTAVDRVAPRRPAVIEELLRFIDTDLLCYRAQAPRELAERQEAVWQPVIDWAGARLGIEVKVTTGVMPFTQDGAVLVGVGDWLAARDAFELAGLHLAAAATGSLLLAIALAENHLSAAEVFAASALDETYQIEQWGDDEEARRRRLNLQKDVAAADLLFKLVIVNRVP